MAVEIRDGTVEDVDDVARVWSAATAARDGDPDPAGLEAARVPIMAVSSERDSVFVVGVVAERVVAFALAAPSTSHGVREADLRFVGVAPDRWGEGLGTRVLGGLVTRLASMRYSAVQLLVYADNTSAIGLYERLGWIAVDEPPRAHPQTGKL